jgi:PST family polysaccharide transporter
MKLLKIFSLNSIAVVIKIICLIVVNKMIAIYVGPSGFAAISQLQNIIQGAMSISTVGVSGAVVKYTAEYSGNEKKLTEYLSTTVLVCFLFTFITSITIFFSADYITSQYLSGADYSYFLKVLSVSLIFTVFNVLCLSIVNGKEKIKLFVILNVFSSLFTLFYSCILIYYSQLTGALFSLVTAQALIAFFIVFYCLKLKVVKLSYFFQGIDVDSLKKTTAFSLMVVIPSLTWPFIYSLIRSDITQSLGIEYAGNWDAMWKFSGIYLSFITSILGIYYLPRLSKIVGKKNLIVELKEGYKIILPFLLLSCITIYFSKNLIIRYLFTDEFYLMAELFGWQLVGDFIKIVAWLISYVFLAKAMVKVQLITEISLAVTFYMLSKYLVDILGFYGVAVAHVVNNSIMLILVILIFYFTKFEKEALK